MTDTLTASGTPEGGAPTRATLPRRQILLAFSGLMLGLFLAALDQTIVATALPTIVGDLRGLQHLSWVVTAYLLTSTATAPLYGKIGDLYGRKRIFQFAIVVFLVGSALSGLSQSMSELIAFRAIQGFGAGGLMVLAITIVGDLVPPRERGRYQGLFGAVFGVSSIVGPLVGGFLVDGPGWRWVFYVNLPIGAVALAVTSIVLTNNSARTEHRIDYTGAALVIAGITGLLLVTVWGGSTYSWTSPTILGTVAASVVLLVAFGIREHYAAEPIMPLRLFRLRIFNVTNAVGFIIGLAMFGAVIYLPVYLQIVHGVSPTESGLLLLPLMVGVLTSSIGSGQIISRIGRYKVFPVIGTVLLTVGMWLLTHLGVHTSYVALSGYMLTVGLGMGSVMQVVVLAVQNGVSYADMGVATAMSTFFRSMGSAFGTAIFGSILTTRLAHWLPLLVPKGVPVSRLLTAVTGAPAELKSLPAPIHAAVVEGFVRSLHTLYLVAIPIAALGFFLSLILPEIRLRQSVGVSGDAEQAAAGVPSGTGGTDGAVTNGAGGGAEDAGGGAEDAGDEADGAEDGGRSGRVEVGVPAPMAEPARDSGG